MIVFGLPIRHLAFAIDSHRYCVIPSSEVLPCSKDYSRG